MIKQLSIIIVFLLFGCTSQKRQIDNKNISFNEVEIIIEKNNDKLFFKIINKSEKESITLHQNKLHIERMNDNKWEKIKLLNCPCGAPCAHQSELIEIPIGKNYVFNWDGKESWCGKKNEYGIPETIKSTCLTGTYRVKITYSTARNKPQITYTEFNIN